MNTPTIGNKPPKRILLVEDEYFSALIIQEELRQLGYEVPAIVSSGEEAVLKAGELMPDLILMDITLEGPMDGIAAAAEIKKTHAMPIIYLTAHTDNITLERAKITEPFGYLTKPYSQNTLATTIEVALYKGAADAARRKAEVALQQARDAHEEELKQSEHRYRTVADFTYDWEFWIAPDGKFLYCSPSCQRVIGHSAAALEHDPTLLRSIVHPDDLAAYDQHCQAAQEGKTIQEFEFRIIRANGQIEWAWLAHSCQPIYDESGRFLGTRGSNRDVTLRKRLEAEAIKDKNLAAIGVLAGGIAHDFNNLFQGLLGNLSLAQMYTSKSSKAFPFLEKAEQVYGEATKLTRQLIAFSSGGGNYPAMHLQASPHIREEVSSSLAGSDIVVEFELPDTLWPINVNPVQFRDVIKHLVQNAREAMSQQVGGTLKIIATNETLEMNHDKHPTLAPGHYLRVSIEDQGCGISREHLPLIFDPYFSTKERGAQKGMGLGLSLCDAVIKKCGGAISVLSKPCKGSTFQVFIPAVMPAATKTAVTKGQGTKGPRILLMDDDPGVVEVTTKYLHLAGYRIDSTMDGEATIAAYEEASAAGDPYALLILDLMISGGMGGKDVIAILKQSAPEVKAIVSSGYTDDHAMTNFSEYGFIAASPKPCLLSELKAIIKRFV